MSTMDGVCMRHNMAITNCWTHSLLHSFTHVYYHVLTRHLRCKALNLCPIGSHLPELATLSKGGLWSYGPPTINGIEWSLPCFFLSSIDVHLVGGAVASYLWTYLRCKWMPLSTRRLCVFKNVSMIFLVSALLKYPSRPSPSSLSSLRSTKSLKLKNKRCFFLRMSHRAHSRSFLVDQPCAPSGQIRQPQRLATISEHLRQTCTALLFHNRPIHDDNVPLSILIVDSMHPLKYNS